MARRRSSAELVLALAASMILTAGVDARPAKSVPIDEWGLRTKMHGHLKPIATAQEPIPAQTTVYMTETLTIDSSTGDPAGAMPAYDWQAAPTFAAAPLAHGERHASHGDRHSHPPRRASSVRVSERSTSDDMIRGVNIGGWLILESWMNGDVFNGTDAIDQYTFDQTDGAEAALQKHWSSWFTESDVEKIASWGINALRIPIGYWAYHTFGTKYIQGADTYLEQAIGWARTNGLKVVIDCHGSPGSQNGFDNSGHAGNVSWQSGNNLNDSITVLETIAEKYGSSSYADVVYAIELVNEPISWDENNFETTQTWAVDAYNAVKARATNSDLLVIMHDGFMGPADWESVGKSINGDATKANAHFAMDVHLYQNQDSAYDVMNQAQHIVAACNMTNSYLLPASAQLPVFVGEFAAGTNICANPNGTTTAGTKCHVDGCQCGASQDITKYSDSLTKATRQFVEAQMDAFEHSSDGWFIWSYHGPGGWGLDNMVEYGLIGNPVTERMYPNQCNF